MTRTGPDLALGALGFFVVVFAGAMASVLPRPLDEPADGAGFSTERALAHVTDLGVEPHVSGSAQHAVVLDRLLAKLRELGVEPAVQRGVADPPWWLDELPWLEPDPAPAEGADDPTPRAEDGRPLVPLTNVLVHLPGTAGEGAVLVQAHYDTKPRSPGAADNAVGVASLLEALRVLLPGAPYRNDLIFHFDDGEELGLLGARLFAEEHPWAKDVRCVLNFDARGNAGPSICFEVGRGSAVLVERFAAEARHPVGASLAAAVYERMRNDTSFSPLRDEGLPGLNFAFVGGASVYHRPQDVPENLSRASLSHQGGYVLAMARAAAELDLDRLGDDEAVFFNALPGRLVRYPLSWSLPLGLGQLGLVGIVLALLARRGVRLGAGLGRALLHGASVLIAVRVVWWIVDFAVGGVASVVGFDGEPQGNLWSAMTSGAGLAAAALATSLALGERAGEERRAELAAGGALVWSLLLLVSTFALPPASYIFGWPLAVALPVLAFARRPHGAPLPVTAMSFVAIAFVLAPVYALLVQIGSVDPPHMANLGSVLVALGVLVLQPHLASLLPKRPGGTARASAVLAVATLALGTLLGAAGR
ncbi:MAG: M28 family peptidase [Planctomycetota bacterium]